MFPFDLVVISFPDDDSARAASPELQGMLGWLPCPWRATTDPGGVRVGSGGAALDAIRNHFTASPSSSSSSGDDPPYSEKGSLLLILAGGESSRAPTQMVMGKAWTSLPTRKPGGEDEPRADAEATLTTPLVVAVRQMGRIMDGLPRGSVVVVAGDTLLRLPDKIRWGTSQKEASADIDGGADSLLTEVEADVIGVAVLAPFETARNHGVYVLDSTNNAEGGDAPREVPTLRPCADVMQKPSMEQLQRTHSSCDSKEEAWIDTGIVIFLPRVVPSLRHLAHQYLGAIERQPAGSPHPPTKLELYTHILQALRTAPSSEPELEARKNRYCQSSLYKPTDTSLASTVWDALSDFSLSVWCLPGDFLHLGTSKELVDFLATAATRHYAPGGTAAASPSTHEPTTTNAALEIQRRVGDSLELVRRCRAYTEHVQFDDPASVVASHVLLKRTLGPNTSTAPRGTFAVGSRTVLEHCCVESRGDRSVSIGSDCLLSGLRYDVDSEYALRIPDRTVVYMATHPTVDAKPGPGSHSVVLMVLGIDDDVKSRSALFGRPIEDFLAWSELSEDDLWDSGTPVSSRTLWNARLHEVIDPRRCTRTIFDLLGEFLQAGENQKASRESLEAISAWRASGRKSLSDIRDAAGTAAAEFEFRRRLDSRIESERASYFENLSFVLSSRTLEPLDWRWIIDDFTASGSTILVQSMLNALDQVVLRSLGEEAGRASFDVCGRACRVSSAFLRDLLDAGCPRKADDNEKDSMLDCFGCASGVSHSESALPSQLKSYVRLRNESMSRAPMQTCLGALSVMDDVAQFMTERCVLGDNAASSLVQRRDRSSTERPIVNRWVVASAPARIDLAGGWTDTPPICFEYGSFVTGLAVQVDGVNPLSCQCRIVPGAKGVLLQTESRGLCVGGQLSSARALKIMTLADLADYRDPSSDCALLKCALVLLGLAPSNIGACNDSESEAEFQKRLNEFCGFDEPVGMEVIASSSLPHGSGLGTSSILGGCVLASIRQCLGGLSRTNEDPIELISSILKLEQLMTTGGGFQDQVNGLIGGAKVVSCDPAMYPLKLQIETLAIIDEAKKGLDDRLMLCFTGKTRLAKSLLQSVVRRWSAQTTDIQDAVESLAVGAKRARDALLQNDMDTLGECLSSYWEQKKLMAGHDSGVEPASVKVLLDELTSQNAIVGASLCGAGGGGFLVLLRSKGATADEVHRIAAACDSQLVWCQCAVSDRGLCVTVES